jgi:3-(3-hydroxy-phenyl)propionate hydroxylase
MRYVYDEFAYATPPALRGEVEARRKVVIVGAGPVGLAMAIDLAQRGVASTVLDDNNVVSVGSRAICWAKRTLEIFDRLGVGARMVEKGVTWKVGRTYHRDKQVFQFDLLPEDGHKMPAFINLQQYYVEQYLVERCADFPDLIDLRFKNAVTGVTPGMGGATVAIDTPDGPYSLEADWVLACDGVRSPIRRAMGLDFDGELFEERFLIADIEMQGEFPSERRFWFEPPFHEGQSALLHKQPDNIYRIDLQLGWDADPEVEKLPERIIPRIEKVVGHGDFTLDWTSVYTFQCRRMERFVHGPVIFVGDSAHVVSPFGARGGNGGVQDVDALGWRLAAVVGGAAPASLIEGYDAERVQGAEENILNSSRSTRFMSPDDGAERVFRDAVLALADRYAFARPMVNPGRLSLPCRYAWGAQAPDDPALPARTGPGWPATDAPLADGWLLDRLGRGFAVLAIGTDAQNVTAGGLTAQAIMLAADGPLAARYIGAAPAAVLLIRPDQVIAARWTGFDRAAVEQALARTGGLA